MAITALLAITALISWYEGPRLISLRLWGELGTMAALMGISAFLWQVQVSGGNFSSLTHWLYAVFAPVTHALIDLLP